jgi:hypothetical protein
MRRPWLIAAAFALFLFLLITFLNCGRASAMTKKERVHRNQIASTGFYVSDSRILGPDTSCKTTTATWAFENYLGNRLFSYTLHGRWCYANGEVSSHRWSDEHHIGNYFWSNWGYRGSDEPIDTGNDGMRYVFRRITGTFSAHVLWFEHTVNPYVQCTLRGDGTSHCGKAA